MTDTHTSLSPTPTVLVSAARFKELEQMEAELPARIADAVTAATADKLRKLHDARKADPKTYSDKVLKKYHENKEEINKRRRDARLAKKLAAAVWDPHAKTAHV